MVVRQSIPEQMKAPLQFVMKSSRRNLSLIRDLEQTMVGMLQRYRQHNPGDTEGLALASRLEDLFRGFDALDISSREERVRRAVTLVESLAATGCSKSDDMHLQSSVSRDDIDAAQRILSEPVQQVRGVGPKIARVLGSRDIHTVGDLLYTIPRRYEDRRHVLPIAKLTGGDRATICGTVTRSVLKRYRGRSIYEVDIDDGTGTLRALWLRGNPSYLERIFQPGARYFCSGSVRSSGTGVSMIHPDYEHCDESGGESLQAGKIMPVYQEMERLPGKTLRRIMRDCLREYGGGIHDPLPDDMRERRGLIPLSDALSEIHIPPGDGDVARLNQWSSDAHRRLIFDELFFFQFGLALRQKERSLEKGAPFRTGGTLLNNYYALLPFPLTAAQKRAIEDILADMERPMPMHRLLQGDVGCGKTVVALVPMIVACENGFQAALMAPTELLAEQHYKTIRPWTDRLGLKAALLTGSLKGNTVKTVEENVRNGSIDIVVGTHALIQDKIDYCRLGMVVIDEQHRFGVVQRSGLAEKGNAPDVLVMTATPIPRTLALTVYGDLALSVIDEMPPSRKPVKTKLFPEEKRDGAYDIVRRELDRGSQAFIVYPLVAESERLDLKDATTMAEHLQRDVFPHRKVGLVHGRMTRDAREQVMDAFREGLIDILVSTTVVEVGIDIPAASVMMIEEADRFGLSQLHQLRGRVGRGGRSSYCLLMAGREATKTARRRLKVMEQSASGFDIAEEDLRIRGPGEFLGIRQSGFPDFRVAHVERDKGLLEEAREEAFLTVSKSSSLPVSRWESLYRAYEHAWGSRFQQAQTG